MKITAFLQLISLKISGKYSTLARISQLCLSLSLIKWWEQIYKPICLTIMEVSIRRSSKTLLKKVPWRSWTNQTYFLDAIRMALSSLWNSKLKSKHIQHKISELQPWFETCEARTDIFWPQNRESVWKYRTPYIKPYFSNCSKTTLKSWNSTTSSSSCQSCTVRICKWESPIAGIS